mmetsp:Transcript_63231/g.95402  ORF Transcript_63231/g.95402 Transcript_63231/m.95402 type:complete len:204 (+) Transcript_63231:63-674(+)
MFRVLMDRKRTPPPSFGFFLGFDSSARPREADEPKGLAAADPSSLSVSAPEPEPCDAESRLLSSRVRLEPPAADSGRLRAPASLSSEPGPHASRITNGLPCRDDLAFASRRLVPATVFVGLLPPECSRSLSLRFLPALDLSLSLSFLLSLSYLSSLSESESSMACSTAWCRLSSCAATRLIALAAAIAPPAAPPTTRLWGETE